MDNWFVYPEKKILACAIPKAGSQSIRKFLSDVSGCDSYARCGRPSLMRLTKDDIQQYIEDPAWFKVIYNLN